MATNEPILRFTEEAHHYLRRRAERDPKIYLDAETDFAAVLAESGLHHYAEPTGITASGPNLAPAS